jgi:hypothetical protein
MEANPFNDKRIADMKLEDNKTEDKFETMSNNPERIRVYPTKFKQIEAKISRFERARSSPDKSRRFLQTLSDEFQPIPVNISNDSCESQGDFSQLLSDKAEQ